MEIVAKIMMGGAFGYLAGYTVEDFTLSCVLTVVFAIGVGLQGIKA